MNAPLPHSSRHPEPFYLDAGKGTRFCIYHPAAPHATRGALVYVHPFAEEMNKSRRMAALQSRALAASGFAVLQVDLFGCGDSCGDFSAARWDTWQDDVAKALGWMASRVDGPLYLWGLRLGGLLALDVASRQPVDGILLWQPVLIGKSCINQFLRLRLAQGMFDAGDAMSSTTALREQLVGHGSIEVAGYELSAEMAHEIDARDAANMRPRTPRVDWIATSVAGESAASAAAARLESLWRGARVRFRHVEGPPFWATTEIAESGAVLAATTDLFARG